MSTIIERLKEMRELREDATDGEWTVNGEYIESSDSGEYVIEGPNAVHQRDAKFIAESANNWLTLITCLEKAVEALENSANEFKLAKQGHDCTACDYDGHTEKEHHAGCVNLKAHEALTEISSLLTRYNQNGNLTTHK